ncbi:DUF5320 domain-containing protein [Candidatus Sumerlaeota bacterium]|nr:DUF5320 domain-containing protein [Candidatus Sumerlaeota bacterium]
MPRGDRTGPMGAGPKSGRAAGYCAGFGAPGSMNQAPGQGRGMGFGRGRGFAGGGGGGRGWRNMFRATGMPGWMRFGGGYAAPMATPSMDPEMEKQALKNQADALQSELELIQKRLAEMETGTAEE